MSVALLMRNAYPALEDAIPHQRQRRWVLVNAALEEYRPTEQRRSGSAMKLIGRFLSFCLILVNHSDVNDLGSSSR